MNWMGGSLLATAAETMVQKQTDCRVQTQTSQSVVRMAYPRPAPRRPREFSNRDHGYPVCSVTDPAEPPRGPRSTRTNRPVADL